jgi:catechol 2,3-dioxygenase-like lactoylglutathione lyase family enzyme
MMPKPDLMGIIVRDMPTALRFYRLLGMDIPADADKEGHVEVKLPGGFRIAWDSLEVINSFAPDYQMPDTPQPALAFLCDSPAEVNKLYADLVAAGYHGHKEPWDAFWGQRYAVILDPDNHLVDLFAPL